MNVKISWYSGLALLLFGSIAQCFGQTPAKNFTSELVAARRQVIKTHDFEIKRLDLGLVSPRDNKFTAIVKNKTKSTLTIGLDLATQPGLWLRRRFQKQFVFEIRPNEQKQIEATYEFSRLTPEASLLVRFGIPALKANGSYEIKDVFFEKRYYVGEGNKAVDYDGSNFNKYETEHFDIYCYKGSLAERELATIKHLRESAYRQISDLLQVNYDRKIRLVFYPDGETKKQEIGHQGDGYAFANNIVEVYNEQIRLDPFHELTHILASKLGNPPAIFNEGFAVYMSERLGADALKYLGSPGKTIDRTTQEYLRDGKLINLEELIKFTEIGSEKSNWRISYPEAASFVKYLIETYGIEKFRKAYQQTKSSDDANEVRKNADILMRIYGKPLAEIEREWLAKLTT